MPLEENWNGRTIESRNKFWSNRGSGFMELPFSGVMTREKMICYDIKKEVISRWAIKNPTPLYDKKSNETIGKKLQELMAALNETLPQNP